MWCPTFRSRSVCIAGLVEDTGAAQDGGVEGNLPDSIRMRLLECCCGLLLLSSMPMAPQSKRSLLPLTFLSRANEGCAWLGK